MPESTDPSAGRKRSPASPTLSHRAYASPRAQLILWLTALVGLALDLISKRWAWAALGKPDETILRPKVLISDYLRLTTVHNPGAVVGIGAYVPRQRPGPDGAGFRHAGQPPDRHQPRGQGDREG